jgi:hypothetical protein
LRPAGQGRDGLQYQLRLSGGDFLSGDGDGEWMVIWIESCLSCDVC